MENSFWTMKIVPTHNLGKICWCHRKFPPKKTKNKKTTTKKLDSIKKHDRELQSRPRSPKWWQLSYFHDHNSIALDQKLVLPNYRSYNLGNMYLQFTCESYINTRICCNVYSTITGQHHLPIKLNQNLAKKDQKHSHKQTQFKTLTKCCSY